MNLPPFSLTSLPCPSTPGRLVRVDDDTVWADTGAEWREATEEEAEAIRAFWAKQCTYTRDPKESRWQRWLRLLR